MQRDYWYDGHCHPDALASPKPWASAPRVIRGAAVAARGADGQLSVLSAEVARSLIGHLLGAVSGGAVSARLLLHSIRASRCCRAESI